MKKRALSLLLVCVMLLTMLPVTANAATQSSYAPYAWIEYGYSSTVKCGTVRYVSQVSSDSYFYSSYWPSGTFGYYTGPSVECGTASISMSLSYIGIDKTPNAILSANNGATVFGTGWGGSTYLSYSATALATATDKYINGNGKYSPPVIHIPGYSAAGHYVVVVGRSGSTYQILDPWQRALTSMTVSGSSATYSTYGYTTYDTIDQIHQWYNASASVDYASTCESFASYCKVQATKSTPINSQPCAVDNNGSTTLETASAGATYTATALYRNTGGNLWYKVTTSGGKTGYLFAGHSSYVEDLTSDIKLTGATAPNGEVVGSGYYVNGTISSSYNYLTKAALYVYSGFGTSGSVAMNSSDTVGGKSYALLYSTIDNNAKFGGLSTGKYTYVIDASYQNHYASDDTTLQTNTGTLRLMEEYFVVIPSSVSQSSCAHSYTTTTIQAATCTAKGVSVESCSICGLINETTTAASGHSYGSWTTVGTTCEAGGYRTRTCSVCGDVQKETLTSIGHDYALTVQNATCVDYARYTYTCGNCGDYYTLSADQLTTTWIDQIPEGMDESLFETKTQYRYADQETTTSYETSLDGYTQLGSQWVKSGSGTVNYVNSWTTGFYTSCDLYKNYNKKSSKVTASETATTKTVIDSDAAVGYLYHHWCYSGSYYSVQSSSGSYTTFHAFYSTTAPGSLSNYDASDGSYYFPNSAHCANSEWWWPTTVNAQKYTTYKKLFTYSRWGAWSDWSDTAATASSTRQVETRTVYRLKEAALTDHRWSNGICATCSKVCGHSYDGGFCTVCGMEEPAKDYYLFGFINGANYACEEDAANTGVYKFVDGKLVVTFTEVSYVAVKTDNNRYWYMTDGYPGDDCTSVTLYSTAVTGERSDKLRIPKGREITFTLVDNGDDTFTLSYIAAECAHTWENGSCSTCDEVCDHYSWTGGTCGVCGLVCSHDSWTEGACDVCDVQCQHTYDQNICTVCGMHKPVKDYYLFGWINGADYGCEADYETMGEYKFVDGKLTAIFQQDSYVALKSHDNLDWYMTRTWLGTEVSAATLYNTTTGSYEKLFVPGGKIVSFVLLDNGNDTYTLSYSAVDCPHTSHDRNGVCGTCGQTVEHRYTTATTAPTCTKSGSAVHTCSVCSYSYTETLAPNGHSYKATVTAPTCTLVGYTTNTCTVCSNQYMSDTVPATGHTYVDGICSSCGEHAGITTPTLTLKYPSLSFEAEILYNVYYIAENIDDVEEMGLATFDTERTDGTVDNATDVIGGYVTDGSLWKVSTNGISAKALGDTLYFKVYAKLTDGSYVYTDMKSYSAVTYANTILKRSTSSSYMKALVVALLNYGTEAQLYFGHNTDRLMNAGLTAQQQALVSAYDESMVDPVVTVDAAKAGSVVFNGTSYVRRAPTVSFDGAFAINYYFTTANVPDGDVKLYYWTLEDYNAAATLKPGNSSGCIIMSPTDVQNQYWGQVSGIAAKELDETVFVAGFYYYQGVAYSTGVLNYSIGKYCEGLAAKDASPQQALAQATAVYGFCAKEYFSNQ